MFDLSVTAKTEVKLMTGGKAGVSRQNLFQISAWANEIQRPPLDNGTGLPWWDVPEMAIAKTRLVVAGKTVGADGNVWLALPDNAAPDITVKAPGIHHFDAGSGAQKYKLTMTANYSDITTNTPEFCVGQQVFLWAEWTPNLPEEPARAPVKWVLGGTYINNYYQPYPSTCSMVYTNDPSRMTNEYATLWWVSGDYDNPPTYTVDFGEGLTFANGQYAAVAAFGKIKMFRPQITGLDVTGNPFVGFGTNDGVFIGVSDAYGSTRHEMEWDLYVDMDLIDYPGALSYLQLINHNDYYNYDHLPIHHSTSGQYWLDNSTEYRDSHENDAKDKMSAEFFYGDAPGIEVAANSYVQDTENFLTYVQFQPNGGIPVTIGIVDWGWIGDAELSGGAWSLVTGILTGPHYNGDDSFPQWSNIWNTGINH